MSAANSAMADQLKNSNGKDIQEKQESYWKFEIHKSDDVTYLNLMRIPGGDKHLGRFSITVPNNNKLETLRIIISKAGDRGFMNTVELFGLDFSIVCPISDATIITWTRDKANSPTGLLQRNNIFDYLRKQGAINNVLAPIEVTKILNPMLYVEREIEKGTELKTIREFVLQQNFPALYDHYRKCLTEKKPKDYFEELFPLYQMRMENSIRDILVPSTEDMTFSHMFNMSYHQVSWDQDGFQACINAAKEQSSVQSKSNTATNTAASIAAVAATTTATAAVAAVTSAITSSASTATATTSTAITATAAPAIISQSGSLDDNEPKYLVSMSAGQKDSKTSSDQKTASETPIPSNNKPATSKLDAWIAYVEAEIKKLSAEIDVTRVRVVGGQGYDNLTGENWQPELRKKNLRYFALSFTLAKLYEEQRNMVKALPTYLFCSQCIEIHAWPKDFIFEDIQTRMSNLHSDIANRINAYFPDLAKAATEENEAGLQAKEKLEQLKKHHHEQALKNRLALYDKSFERTIEPDDVLAYNAVHQLIHGNAPEMLIHERHKTPKFSKEDLPFIIMSEMRQSNQRHAAEMEKLKAENLELRKMFSTLLSEVRTLQAQTTPIPRNSSTATNPTSAALVFSTMPTAATTASTPTPNASTTNSPTK